MDDLLGGFDDASRWAMSKAQGAAGRLDAPTSCDGWDVGTLLDHMTETQRYFAGTARGEDVSPPSPEGPSDRSNDPVAELQRACAETAAAFAPAGVVERTGPLLGVALSDQLLHGWDIATATGQDASMPDGLAEVAYEIMHGSFTDDQREGVFKPERDLPADPSAQDRLLAYSGRPPGSG